MTRRITITSSAFEDLIRRLPSYVDVVITADATHKFCELDGVTYIAPLEAVASGRSEAGQAGLGIFLLDAVILAVYFVLVLAVAR